MRRPLPVEESRGAVFDDIEQAAACVDVMEGSGWRLVYACDLPNGSVVVRMARPGPSIVCSCYRCRGAS